MTPLQAGALVLTFVLALYAADRILRWVGDLGELLDEIQRGEPIELAGRGGPPVIGRDVRLEQAAAIGAFGVRCYVCRLCGADEGENCREPGADCPAGVSAEDAAELVREIFERRVGAP